jgi:CTD small phosphatase-like protein 2
MPRIREFKENKERQKTVIFDMDETLIRAEFNFMDKPDFVPDFIISIDGKDVGVKKRPYLEQVLLRLSLIYEIFVFTAGEQYYADKILDILDPDNTIFS